MINSESVTLRADPVPETGGAKWHWTDSCKRGLLALGKEPNPRAGPLPTPFHRLPAKFGGRGSDSDGTVLRATVRSNRESGRLPEKWRRLTLAAVSARSGIFPTLLVEKHQLAAAQVESIPFAARRHLGGQTVANRLSLALGADDPVAAKSLEVV